MAKARAESRRYVKVTEVYVSEVFNKSGPTARCCAPGCGDKIKPLNSSDSCYEIMWLDGDVTYLESGCLDWFVNGHPDYGNGFGKIAPPLNCAVSTEAGSGASPLLLQRSAQVDADLHDGPTADSRSLVYNAYPMC